MIDMASLTHVLNKEVWIALIWMVDDELAEDEALRCRRIGRRRIRIDQPVGADDGVVEDGVRLAVIDRAVGISAWRTLVLPWNLADIRVAEQNSGDVNVQWYVYALTSRCRICYSQQTKVASLKLWHFSSSNNYGRTCSLQKVLLINKDTLYNVENNS